MSLRTIVTTIKQLFRHDSVADSQRYQIAYTAQIQNTSETDQNVSVLMPYIESRGEFQNIAVEPAFNPRMTEVLTDSVFHNKIAVWQGNIPAQSTRQFIQTCAVDVHSRHENVPDDLTIDQYTSEQRMLYAGGSIDSTNPALIAIAEMLKDPEGTIKASIENINDYVISSLTYGNPIDGLYTSQQAIDNDCVDCGGFDTLMIALLGAVGIPARLVSGFWLDGSKNDMHAWLEILLPDETWVVADPSIENLRKHKRTRKQGALGLAGSDRLVVSVGSDLEVAIADQRITIPILQHPYVISDDSETVKASAFVMLQS